jgi:hypothetical protein
LGATLFTADFKRAGDGLIFLVYTPKIVVMVGQDDAGLGGGKNIIIAKQACGQ